MLAKKYESIHRIIWNNITDKSMIYFFDGLSSYLKLRKHISYSYKFVNETKTLYITVITINRNIVINTFTPKLAHEIRHALQYKKTGRKYLHNYQYYDATLKLFDKNPIIKAVSNIIYLSSRYEQESYAEEMYNELLFNNKDISSLYKETNSWKAYEAMKKCLELVIKNKNHQEVKNEIEKRGYTIEKFLQIAEKSCRRFLKYLSRAIVMAQKGKFKREDI